MLDDGDVAIMMVEAGGTEGTWGLYEEGAPKVTEEVIAEGLEDSKQWIEASIELQNQLRAEVDLGARPDRRRSRTRSTSTTRRRVRRRRRAAPTTRPREAMAIADKNERNDRLDEIHDGLLLGLVGTADEPGHVRRRAPRRSSARSARCRRRSSRSRIVNEGVRIDGRGPTDLRPLSAEDGMLPTSHGDGLFQRGETQVLSVVTLGMPRMEQILGLDELRGPQALHAPLQLPAVLHRRDRPRRLAEAARDRSRRARRAGARAGRPAQARVALHAARRLRRARSNGSTSMASVCGSTLSLMDAGVPIKAPVAGIAMGLVYAEGKYTTLTDILGTEDAFGDMDFKVAGTREFVTALQLDTKIDGIPADVLAARRCSRPRKPASRSSTSCTPRSPRPATTCARPHRRSSASRSRSTRSAR